MKTLLRISAICAACSMFSGAAWAQVDSQNRPVTDQNKPASTVTEGQNMRGQNARSWSTKRLTATGRMNDNAVRASKLVGATIKDSFGQRAGQIQDIIINPASGRIDFALVSIQPIGNENSTENINAKLVPVPWALLRTSANSVYSANAGQPTFTMTADRSKLASAPSVDWSDLNQSEWRQRIYSYYGVTPQPSMGGAETPSGEIKGEGARDSHENNSLTPQQQENQTPQSQQQNQ